MLALPLGPRRHCIAELNVQMEAHFRSVRGCDLKAYHSFTRSSKEVSWARYSAASGLDVTTPATSWPLHHRLITFLLQVDLLASHP